MGYSHNVKDNVHNVVDFESGHEHRFVIDHITRQITNKSGKVVLTKLDHNSECFTFEIPEKIEGHDMSKCNMVEVHFINIDSATRATNSDVYRIEDGLAYDAENKVYTFSWLISQSATQYAGTLSFAVRFACYPETEEGVITSSNPLYSWSTGVFSGITIIDSIFATEQFIEDYSDILENWWIKINRVMADETIYAITGDSLVDLTTLLDNFEKDISGLKEADTELGERVKKLEEDTTVSDLAGRVTKLEGDTTVSDLAGRVTKLEEDTTVSGKLSGLEGEVSKLQQVDIELGKKVASLETAEVDLSKIYPVGSIFYTTEEEGYPKGLVWERVTSAPKSKEVGGTASEDQLVGDGNVLDVIGTVSLGLGCSNVTISQTVGALGSIPSVTYDETTGIATWTIRAIKIGGSVKGVISYNAPLDSPFYVYERIE